MTRALCAPHVCAVLTIPVLFACMAAYSPLPPPSTLSPPSAPSPPSPLPPSLSQPLLPPPLLPPPRPSPPPATPQAMHTLITMLSSMCLTPLHLSGGPFTEVGMNLCFLRVFFVSLSDPWRGSRQRDEDVSHGRAEGGAASPARPRHVRAAATGARGTTTCPRCPCPRSWCWCWRWC